MLPRIASGDRAAVEQCLQTYGGLVWSMARRYTGTNADAEDAVQDIFVDLWQSASRFDATKSSEASFISMIARRRLIDRVRRKSRQPSMESLLEDSSDVVGPNQKDPIELGDEVEKAKHCFAKLSPRQRDVLQLSIHEGCAHQGIADQLGIPLGTVKTYARRGLIQLRDCMKRTMGQMVEGASS